LVGWLVGWLVKFWLGLPNPLFLPAYESEMRRNNVALLPDIYLIVSKNVPTWTEAFTMQPSLSRWW